MKFMIYQILAARTQNDKLSNTETLHHALFGLAGETGEILSIYQKGLQGHEIDTDKVVDEMGDLLWFLSELADCLNVDLDYVAEKNIDKLKRRYPDGFDAERSVHREES